MKYLAIVVLFFSCSQSRGKEQLSENLRIASAAVPSQNTAVSQNMSDTDKKTSPAPDFFGLEWYNSKKERIPNLRLKDLKGKLTFIDVFIKTCPGCPKSHKIFKKIYSKYKNRKDIQFLAIQSVSYGHKKNNLDALHQIRKEYGFDFPMAQDNQAVVIAQYGAGGTPWNIVIGPKGTIEHNYFFISEKDADKYVKNLL